ncbi:MAG: MBL fold metallo-hydrolase [Gammaproteobacteria bacterium]
MSFRKLTVVLVVLVVASVLVVDLASLSAETSAINALAHHLKRGFRNVDPSYSYTMSGRAAKLLSRAFERWPARGTPPVVLTNDGGEIRANGQVPTVTWVGHATFLVQVAGLNILTDPHWGDRASPVQFAGPRRLVPPGMRFEDLPPIHAVVISHDHYDHLDSATVARLAREHAPTFFVPLGYKAWLADHGVRDVVELDWWQGRDFRGLRLTCTPTQHSSGRGFHDQNLRLWSSWVIASQTRRLFFAGDTGYWSGGKEIGQRLGPFDAALIPIGGYSSYDKRHPNHVNPEEAVQLFEDVRGRLMIPMHWGTFELNREPFLEPPQRLQREALRLGLEEQIALLSPGQTIHW